MWLAHKLYLNHLSVPIPCTEHSNGPLIGHYSNTTVKVNSESNFILNLLKEFQNQIKSLGSLTYAGLDRKIPELKFSDKYYILPNNANLLNVYDNDN